MTGPAGQTSADAVLRVSAVDKAFDVDGRRVQALSEVSLEVPPGQVTGLIGPDGAGKTTLMRLAACLLQPDAGTIRVLDMDAAESPLAVQAAVGYMPQRFGLYEDLTVAENLDLYADLQGVPRSDRPDRYRELTRMTNLGDFTDRLAGRLSGGMKQKLGLACTLVHPPRLLLLDEPTVGVDPVSRRELWEIVAQLVAESEMSVLLSTAYLDEAERCDTVILLHEGKLLGEGTPADFRERERGRTYHVSAPGIHRRDLQDQLAGRPGVTDAIIQGEVVRLVLADEDGPEGGIASLLPDVDDLRVEAVEPRFEDRYVAMLADGHRPEPAEVAGRTDGKADDGPVIHVKSVSRRFGDFYAVKKLSFDVGRGEIFGLLGANGAGKTTTFRMLCGLLPPSEGELTVAGRDLRRAAAEARARIGYMSQKFSLYGNLSVTHNLQFFSAAYGLRGERRAERMDWALTQFDLEKRADLPAGDLPLGYKQRLALACALMHEPEILFLDEPTSGVDPMARREFWHHINDLARHGVTVLVTTHFMAEAEYCDRMAIMAAGEILSLGTPAEIRKRAADVSGETIDSMEAAFIALIEHDDGGQS